MRFGAHDYGIMRIRAKDYGNWDYESAIIPRRDLDHGTLDDCGTLDDLGTLDDHGILEEGVRGDEHGTSDDHGTFDDHGSLDDRGIWTRVFVTLLTIRFMRIN